MTKHRNNERWYRSEIVFLLRLFRQTEQNKYNGFMMYERLNVGLSSNPSYYKFLESEEAEAIQQLSPVIASE